MPRPRSERRSPWPAVVVFAVLVLLPALYVASIGPSGRLVPDLIADDSGVGLEWQTAFTPILWATDRSDSLNGGLQGYLRFWGAEEAVAIVAYRRLFRRTIEG